MFSSPFACCPSQFWRRVILYFDVIRRLGFSNVVYVAWYRFTLKTGVRKWLFPQRTFKKVDVTFYRPIESCSDYPTEWKNALFDAADKIIQGQLRYFTYHWKVIGNPPNWFLNPFNSRTWPNSRQHWTDLDDFNTEIGDIKNVWEASRLEWAVTLSRAYAVSGKTIYLDVLNQWLNDWAEKNPVNTGPNWKCGQEASIRVFNLINAALILNQWDNPSPVLEDFIYQHLERISHNIGYAIAQDNNHGISEASALFIGGYWLAKNSHFHPHLKRYEHFARQGRKWLEDRIKKLVQEEDGSFSQHSMTYHRVLLDTLTFVEYWRRKLEVDPFSDTFYHRAKAAINWMFIFTDPISGNAPNLGANDGALLLNTHSCDYREFCPSIQTASVLFRAQKIFTHGPWDEPGYWFGLSCQNSEKSGRKRTSEVLPGGYVAMVGKGTWGMIRFPMYQFRPSHNDVFHFDLWHKGENICRDAGSYSYNPQEKADSVYFKSVKAHNTVSFDDLEQMPQVGRFMMGKWIRADHISSIEHADDGSNFWIGSYRDYRGNSHQRRITWKEDNWVIEDSFSGGFEKAEIIYRLIVDSYQIEGKSITASWGRIEILGSGCEIIMSKGYESLYYWQKQDIDMLVLHVSKHCRKVITRFIFRE